MPASLVQSKRFESSSDVSSVTLALDSLPGEGNTLVAFINSDATVDETALVNQGWTLQAKAVNITGLYQWAKVATQGDSGAITITPTVSAATAVLLREYTSMSIDPFDRGWDDTSAPSFTTTVNSGTTQDPTSQDDELALVAFARGGTDFAVSSLTNGFTVEESLVGLGTHPNTMVICSKALSAIDMPGTTATISGGSLAPSGLIATYKAALAGPVGRSLIQRWEQAPNAFDVDVENSGSGTLNWTASANVSWLVLTPTSGTAPSTLNVKLDPSGLQPGDYSGVVTVASTGATNTPQSLPVTLHVPAPMSSVGASLHQEYETIGGSLPPALPWGAGSGWSIIVI